MGRRKIQRNLKLQMLSATCRHAIRRKSKKSHPDAEFVCRKSVGVRATCGNSKIAQVTASRYHPYQLVCKNTCRNALPPLATCGKIKSKFGAAKQNIY